MNGLSVCGILAGMIYFFLFNMTCIYFILSIIFIYFLLSWILIPSSARKYNNPRRKVMVSTWSDPIRPQIFGYFKVKASNALLFLEKASKKTGQQITMTHLVMKAIGKVLSEFPEVVGKIDFGNYKVMSRVDASCLILVGDSKELNIVPISDVPNKPFSVIAHEIKAKSDSIASGEEYKKYKGFCEFLEKLPTCLIAIILEVLSFMNVTIGLKFLGFKPNFFGTFIVSDMSMYNSEISYPPLLPMARNPLIITITSVHEEAIVENSEVVVAKLMNICVTLDHRYTDGFKAVKIQNRIKSVLESPEEFLNID